MKKFIAFMLVFMMVLSTTAFAAEDRITSIELNGKYYTYDKDAEIFNEVNPEAGLLFNESYYIFLQEPLASHDVDDLKNYAFKGEFEEGAKYIKAVEFVRVKEDNNGDRRLAIKITTANVTTTESFEVVGDILLKARRASEIVIPGNVSADEIILLSLNTEISNGDATPADIWDYETDGPVVTFEGLDEETIIYFGDGVTFEVDVRNQKKLYLEYSNDVIDELYDEYDEYDLTFVLFPSALDTFRKTGELYIPYECEKGTPHIYEIDSNNCLTEVSNARWDDFDEAFTIKTKTLKDYVICDHALQIVTVTTPIINNPQTGACA